MKLYKPTYTKNGTKRTCQVWYVRARVNGERFRKTTGCRDRRAATQKAVQMIQDAERIAAGLEDPFEKHWARPLETHVADFEATLRARGVTDQYVKDRVGLLRAFVLYAGCERLRDLDDADASRWLAAERERGLAARTVNRRYQALRQFGRWLVEAQRMSRAPFATLRQLKEKADRRRVRRALTFEELERLIASAAARPLGVELRLRVNAGVSNREKDRLVRLGQVRATVYRLAAGTGLRRGELQRLTWGDIDLPTRLLTVPAASSKSKEDQPVPLRSDLAAILTGRQPSAARPQDLVFSLALFPSLRTFKRDLAEAGIIRREFIERDPVRGKRRRPLEVFHAEDERGRVVDFHSLRYTFVSLLTQAGVHPKHVQALARHARIDLTMNVYTDLQLADLRAAMERTAPDDE